MNKITTTTALVFAGLFVALSLGVNSLKEKLEKENRKNSQKSLDHIFSGKVEKLPRNGPLKISGYHSDFKGKAFK